MFSKSHKSEIFNLKCLLLKWKNLNETVVDVRLLNRGHSGAKELSGYIHAHSI